MPPLSRRCAHKSSYVVGSFFLPGPPILERGGLEALAQKLNFAFGQ